LKKYHYVALMNGEYQISIHRDSQRIVTEHKGFLLFLLSKGLNREFC